MVKWKGHDKKKSISSTLSQDVCIFVSKVIYKDSLCSSESLEIESINGLWNSQPLVKISDTVVCIMVLESVSCCVPPILIGQLI